MNEARVVTKNVKSAALIAFAFLLGLGLTLFLISPGSSAGAQEATSEVQETTSEETAEVREEAEVAASDEEGVLYFDEIESGAAASQRAKPEPPGPLAGVEVETANTDKDIFIERVEITTPGLCETQTKGVSFVLQDGDGTQGTFVDGENVQIEVVPGKLIVRSTPPNDPPDNNNIEAIAVRGGEENDNGEVRLADRDLKVATSTNITCEDDVTPPDDDDDNGDDGDDNGDDGDDTGNDDDNEENGNGNEELPEEEQDDVEGPLAGGTAYGFDEIVPEDIIRTLPDGTVIYGLDRIRIYTENCDITESEDLSFTLEQSEGLFRVRDRDNVNITLEEDGTFVIDGREEVRGEPNPDQLIIPIPVDPENYEPNDEPEDTFPIVSSTGVGGEDCKAVLAETTTSENTNSNNGNSNNGDRESSVMDGTYDANKTLANTGGATVGLVGLNPVSAVLIPSGALLVVFGVGAGLWLRRNGLAGRE